MRLPRPGPAYDAGDQARTREAIDRELSDCIKGGQDIDLRSHRIIGTSPDGNQWVLGVSNAGATTWTPL